MRLTAIHMSAHDRRFSASGPPVLGDVIVPPLSPALFLLPFAHDQAILLQLV